MAYLRQTCRAIAACLIVFASLVVFPNAVPWLIAAWLLGYTLLVLRGRHGAICLAACAAVLVLKRLTPAPGLLVLLAVMCGTVAIRLLHRRKAAEPTSPIGAAPSRRFGLLSALVLWIAWGGMALDWFGEAHCHHRVVFDARRPIVCIGDSMTSCGAFGGYPSELQERLSVPVVNLGIGGITAEQTVKDLKTFLPEIASHRPQAVVIELGAHDFLRNFGRAATKANLKTIIDAVRKIGAEPVLMEIPRAFLSDPFWGLEREIARQQDIELVPDTAMRVIFLRSTAFPPGSWLGEPYLTDETGIHPNARGRQLLADAVAEALARIYGPQIRRPL